MATVDYLPVAAAGGANVETQGAFAGSAHQLTGFVAGIALSAQLNKCWRQSSVMSAAIANLIADITAQNVLDDGNVTALVGLLSMALNGAAYLGTSGGAANVQTLTPTIPLVALVAGQAFRFTAGFSNTGATTVNISGLGAVAVQVATSTGTVALSGGEIVAGAVVSLIYNGTVFIISGIKATPTTVKKQGTNGGDYTTASAAYVAVDGANLAATITIPVGWKLLVSVSGCWSEAGGGSSAAICIADGGGAIQQTKIGVTAGGAPCTTGFSLQQVINGDGAAHTIDLRFLTSGGSFSNIVIVNSAGFFPVMTFFLTPSN